MRRLAAWVAALLILLLAAVYAGLALVPLADVLARVPQAREAYAQASGTLLDGQVTSLRLGPLPLGAVGVRFDPWSLLRASPSVALRTLPPAGPLRADVTLSGSDVEIAMRGTLSLAGAFGELPVGKLAFLGTRADFSGGRCVAAGGAIEAVLQVPVERVALPEQLGGFARCDGAALLLPFQESTGRAGLELRVRPGQGWSADVHLLPPPDAVPALLAQGFRPDPVRGGYRLVVTRSF